MAKKTTTIVLSGLLLLGSLGMVAGTAAAETTESQEDLTVPGQIGQSSSSPSDAELQEAVEAEYDVNLPEDAKVVAVESGQNPVEVGVSATNSGICATVWIFGEEALRTCVG